MSAESQHIAWHGQEFEAADADKCDRHFDEFLQAILRELRAALPRVEIIRDGGSMGSEYYSLRLEGREWTCIRVSNHKQGRCGESLPVWSFETTDTAEQHAKGLQAVVDAVKAAAVEED